MASSNKKKNNTKPEAPAAKRTDYDQKKREKQETETKHLLQEALLWLLLAACVFMFISYLGIGGTVGEIISDISFGIFGICAYMLPLFIFITSLFLVSNKGNHIAGFKAFAAFVFYVCICCFAALVASENELTTNISMLYYSCAATKSGGGVLGGLLSALLMPAVGDIGTVLILIVLMVISGILITQKSLMRGVRHQSARVYQSAKESSARRREEYPRPTELDIPAFTSDSYRKNRNNRRTSNGSVDTLIEPVPELAPEIELPSFLKHEENSVPVSADIEEIFPDPDISETSFIDLETDMEQDWGKVNSPIPKLEIYHEKNNFNTNEFNANESNTKVFEAADFFEEPDSFDSAEMQKKERKPAKSSAKKNLRSAKREAEDGIASVEAEAAKTANTLHSTYTFPPLELLKKGKKAASKGQELEVKKTAAKLKQTLESFGVHVTITNVSCGPAVTRYELQPEQGVKVSRIVGLSDDIKLNLAAADIRIEAPIPGKAAVGIEVPNSENSTVSLRDLLESEEFRKHSSRLAFATGKDIAGKVVVSDIAKMPHLLIAGATGSGKSVCINTLIMSILFKADPEDVKLIMIDPKVVELSVYNGIPHLFIPVVTDPKKAAGALNWGVAEMTERYNRFAEYGVRDLKGYNKKIEGLKNIEDENKPKKMPQIIIIVDELADLMMVAPGEVEDSICRLAQLARAAGIHLVIATQRPSVNVITGLIKANMPSRIAFSVTSSIDSRTILDMGGAEKLLGKGDMLFYPQGYQKPARVQGAFVSDEEVSDVVDFLKNQNAQTNYDSTIEEKISQVQLTAGNSHVESDVDLLFADAGKFIIEKDRASIGVLQRVFKIGFNRAARIMDQLSEAGVVGPEEGTKPRKVLMSAEEFENYLEQN